MAARRSRGQGALEQLMNYGWAVIAVVVVGVVIWQLGYLNRDSSATTASGFKSIKPLLSTVSMGEDGVLFAVFVNGVGLPITVTAVAVRNNADGGLLCCSNQHFIPDGETQPCGKHAASDIAGSNFDGFCHCAAPQGTGMGPRINKGDAFKVELGRYAGGGPGSSGWPDANCRIGGLAVGDDYEIAVEFYYDTNIQGSAVSKRDSGVIRGRIE
jgi:hypothetical protein